jgi:hypothetical protein
LRSGRIGQGREQRNSNPDKLADKFADVVAKQRRKEFSDIGRLGQLLRLHAALQQGTSFGFGSAVARQHLDVGTGDTLFLTATLERKTNRPRRS